MRTYEDSFSGARIYPGKVRSMFSPSVVRSGRRNEVVAWPPLSQKDTTHWHGGKLYVRGDSKIFRFQNGKSESLFLQRKNPRRISWTVLYRRQHRKGISEEVAKKRTRKTVKAQRGIVGASLDVIKEKRNIRPEARSAARAAAIKESKDKKQADAAAKKAEKAKLAASSAKGQGRQISKQSAKGAQSKPKPTTR
ncbi:hypothetical protein AK830_g1442 [Neonectria ditissima]|uniref:Large ribosomal subunit protein eL24-related N-terminal domain-containing protein n=1 Tax=Neonectria ditissima TaxID=78410 RepID=A0A0P7BUK4_9HYPO|nr:hypothetical protein AK830_g1442 [Neonectria ditissima]